MVFQSYKIKKVYGSMLGPYHRSYLKS